MWTAFEGLPVRANTQARPIIPIAFQRQGAFLVRQSDKFTDVRVCCCVIPAPDMGQRCAGQRIHQRGGLADLTRIVERVLSVLERGVGIANQPQSGRPPRIRLLPATSGQIASPADDAPRVVKRHRLIEMRSPFRDVSRTHQGNAHDPMPDTSGTVAPCFSASARKCVASSRTDVTVERRKVRDPEAV